MPSGTPFEERILKWLLGLIGNAPVRLALENGASTAPPDCEPVGTIVFADLRELLTLPLDVEGVFASQYARGEARVEGDLGRVLESLYLAMRDLPKASAPVRMAMRVLAWTRDNTLRGSRENIRHHYDLGNEFYRRWLDQELSYTCAYFPTQDYTLEQAQRAKMDLVGHKLRLHPGETVIEAGCGWGCLALHLARRFGVRVLAWNISREQIRFAREKARETGLSRFVDFIEDDYRNINGRADAFVSLGMLEHVGTSHYRELGDVIHRVVGHGGRGLLHFIGRSHAEPLNPWISRHIFPGAYVPTLRESLAVLEPHDYLVNDVENLRRHYALTLDHWLKRHEATYQATVAEFGEEFARAWRLYLAGSAAAFRTGSLQLFQVLFAGRDYVGTPWTRASLYTAEAPCEVRIS